ncbi:hypothetical protein V7S76_12960 [Aquirufa sp. ROCK2-A2]
MLKHEQNILLVDLLFDDEQIGDFVKSIQIDSPYQQMLMEGVLTESVQDEKLFVSFTVEGYFHFVLGDIIFEYSQDKDYNYFISLLENNLLNGVKEGMEQCLIKEVNLGQFERLVSLIDVGGEVEIVARFPLVHAFMKIRVVDIFQKLMSKPTVHDWNVIKHVRGVLLANQKQHVVDQLDGILKESVQLKQTINELLQSENEIDFKESLTLISFYTNMNALDLAKQYYKQFIEEAEKRNNHESLVEALELLGDSEYKRSGHDGYKAAMDALTRVVEIRESETSPQNDKLKYTYRLLGLAYLSLGLQVVKSTEYFEKTKVLMLEKSSDSAELAEINLYIGLANFWRGLRGIGRWGNADPTLLEGIDIDLFEYADKQFQLAYHYHFRNLGKCHPQSLEAIHYLQENRYAMGNYEQAIPWLEKYVEAIPFKTREHTDYYYLYCLIVSLEESAKFNASNNKKNALNFIQKAIFLIKNYDEDNQISNRLLSVKQGIEVGNIDFPQYTLVEELPALELDSKLKAEWRIWQFSEALKGFHTNNWLVDPNGIWFFNNDKKHLVFWNKINHTLTTFNPSNWPEGSGRLIYDQNNQIFYAWSSIRSTVFELTAPDGNWTRLSFGVHDVHACGASFGFDPINRRLFEFGGYGYFTYKNWLWVYDITEKKWIQLKENKPGISPYPRNGQLLHTNDNTKVVLLSGIGSDTGIQREHKARLGLANATDVGYFTWLRDAHELDLKTLEWKTILPANHESIRHEGPMGFIEELNLVVNWGGQVPSPIFGKDPEIQNRLSGWQLSNNKGFLDMKFDGEIPPLTEGIFISIKDSKELLYNHSQGIWKLVINDF